MKEHSEEFGRQIRTLLKLTTALSAFLVVVAGCGFASMQFYMEHEGMGSPASLWEAIDAQGDDVFGWELENEDWTGGLVGGTSSALSGEVRRALRGAWSTKTWGTDIDPEEVLSAMTGKERPNTPDSLKGMIGLIVEEAEIGDAVSRSQTISLAYLDHALRLAAEDGVAFPPEEPNSRQALSLPALSHATPRRPRPSYELGIALLLRRANILEQRASRSDLHNARLLYGRILRAVFDVEGAETLEAKLARKLGDIGCQLSDPDAENWFHWGIARLVGAGDIKDSVAFNPELPTSSTGSHRSPSPLGGSHLDIVHLLSLKAPADLPPPRLRALLSLLTSLSVAQARPKTLSSALETQLASLNFIEAALASSDLSSPDPSQPPSPARHLHNLSLQLTQATISSHFAEVLYATRPRTDEALERQQADQAIQWLQSTLTRSASVIHLISTAPNTPMPSSFPIPAAETKIPTEPSHRIRSIQTLKQPATTILWAARKVAASSANLLALLLTRTTSTATLPYTPEQLKAAVEAYSGDLVPGASVGACLTLSSLV